MIVILGAPFQGFYQRGIDTQGVARGVALGSG